jgi:enterochelin esterase family protein
MKIISRPVLALFAIIFILTFGCTKSSSPSFISSSTPTNEQIKNNSFVKFVNELKNLPVEKRLTELQHFINDNPNSPIIEDHGLACFYWYGKANYVLINGDVQYGWAIPDTMNFVSCGDSNLFYKIYSLPADARIDYQLIVDDSIITDPRNPIITPSGFGEHSQCAMPMFKSKTVLQYRTNINYGTVDSLLFQSGKTSMLPRMLKIYKPAGYDSLAELPAIFINDGFKAIDYCFYIHVVDNLIADKKIKPVIVVFINFVEGDQDYFLNQTDEYFTAICNELVPLIDSNYKTSKQAKDRLLTGISAGAHISLLTALKKFDVFLNAAGQSPTTTEELFDAVNSIDKQTKKELKLYFDVGRFDLRQGGINNHSFLYSNQLLSKEMKKAGINHHFKVFNDGHEWANWRESVDEILIYFWGN